MQRMPTFDLGMPSRIQWLANQTMVLTAESCTSFLEADVIRFVAT
jgi:hypothetical protein